MGKPKGDKRDRPDGDLGDSQAVDAPAPTDEHAAALEAELAQWKDRALRARADYDNLVRRVEAEAAVERDRVKARVLEGFLQVYEYGQMAAWEAERNPGPLAEGVKMVVREFDRLLEREGVRPIGEVGDPFDRQRHEAVATEPGDDIPPGCVSRVVAPGYRLGDRVLRYAKVAVAPQPGADAVPRQNRADDSPAGTGA
jgi:molecular chaperone GrpE